MKLRIQDSSVRFRITLKELEIIESGGGIEKACHLPNGTVFRYMASINRELPESRMVAEPFSIAIELSTPDAEQLSDPAQEGVYIRREWTDDTGEPRRFMAFIEKDRPASTCKKIEAWIYEGHNGGENVLVPKSGQYP